MHPPSSLDSDPLPAALNGHKLPWTAPVVVELPPEDAADVRQRFPEFSPAEPAPCSISHNSGNSEPIADDTRLPAWATPSKLPFEDVAALNTGANRLSRQPASCRLSSPTPGSGMYRSRGCSSPAIISYLNRETGTAYPGLKKRLAEDIYHELRKLPPKTAEQVLKNAVTLVRQCGYLLSRKMAAPGGTRAVANYTIDLPDPDERRQAAVAYEAWQAEEAGKQATRRATKADGSGNPPGYLSRKVTHPVTSAQVPEWVTSEVLR